MLYIKAISRLGLEWRVIGASSGKVDDGSGARSDLAFLCLGSLIAGHGPSRSGGAGKSVLGERRKIGRCASSYDGNDCGVMSSQNATQFHLVLADSFENSLSSLLRCVPKNRFVNSIRLCDLVIHKSASA